MARHFHLWPLVASAALLAGLSTLPARSRSDDATDRLQPKPVVDVEQLMEDLVNPAFVSLRSELRTKPRDAKAWQRVRAASTVLSESGNLLLLRTPDEADDRTWKTLSIDLRVAGELMLDAVRRRDDAAVRGAYAAVVHACNVCHVQFGEDGEPKIDP